jgi:hypothetical protein
VSLFTLGLVFGYFVDKRAWVRVVIALSVGSGGHSSRTACVSPAPASAAHNYGGGRFVEGIFHEFSGWVVFVLAFMMMFGVQAPASANQTAADARPCR